MALSTLPVVGEFIGLLLASYGAVREGFTRLTEQRNYGGRTPWRND